MDEQRSHAEAVADAMDQPEPDRSAAGFSDDPEVEARVKDGIDVALETLADAGRPGDDVIYTIRLGLRQLLRAVEPLGITSQGIAAAGYSQPWRRLEALPSRRGEVEPWQPSTPAENQIAATIAGLMDLESRAIADREPIDPAEIESLHRHLAALARTVERTCARGEVRRERQRGASVRNAAHQTARLAARKVAAELIASDADGEFEKADILRLVSDELARQELTAPSDRKLWDWLKESPSVIPHRMTRPGRPPK